MSAIDSLRELSIRSNPGSPRFSPKEVNIRSKLGIHRLSPQEVGNHLRSGNLQRAGFQIVACTGYI